jgi:hypothetical protein
VDVVVAHARVGVEAVFGAEAVGCLDVGCVAGEGWWG